MKTFIRSWVGLVVLTFVSTGIAAGPKGTTKTSSTGATATASTTVYRSPSADGGVRFGFGLASYGVNVGAAAAVAPALSLWMDLGSSISIQALFGIQATNPFTFGGGGIFRYTVLGNQNDGFHLGAGFNLGTLGLPANNFYVNALGVAGFHFTLASSGVLSNLQLCFDGGPIFMITPTFQFMATPISGLLGAAITYKF